MSPDESLIAIQSLNGGVWLFTTRGQRQRELTFRYRKSNSSWSGEEGTPWSMAF